MTAQPNWGTTYIASIRALIDAIEGVRTQADILNSNSGLPAAYLSAVGAQRADLVAQDFVNANSALTQMLFTFDSGAPTQKSYLFKVI